MEGTPPPGKLRPSSISYQEPKTLVSASPTRLEDTPGILVPPLILPPTLFSWPCELWGNLRTEDQPHLGNTLTSEAHSPPRAMCPEPDRCETAPADTPAVLPDQPPDTSTGRHATNANTEPMWSQNAEQHLEDEEEGGGRDVDGTCQVALLLEGTDWAQGTEQVNPRLP